MNEGDLSENERLRIGASIILGFGKGIMAYREAAKVAETMEIPDIDLEQVSPQQQVESVCLFIRKTLDGAKVAKLCSMTKDNLDQVDVVCRLCHPPEVQATTASLDPDTKCFAKAFYETSYSDPNQGVARALDFFNLVSEDAGGTVFFSRSVAIAQSSGSGKSRLIYELAANIPTIYVCPRKPEDTGIPRKSSVDIYDLIVKGPPPHIKNGSPNKADLWIYSRCVAFFCVANIFTLAAWASPTKPSEFVLEARNFHPFFHMQEKAAFWQIFAGYLEKFGQSIYDLIDKDADLRKIPHHSLSYWDWIEEITQEFTCNLMPHWYSPLKVNHLHSIICIDEAREFVRYEPHCLIDTLAHMNRAARLLSYGSIFAFMTTPGDIKIPDPAPVSPSARARSQGSTQATFTDLVYWDLLATAENSDSAQTIFDTILTRYMAKFGRPLWGAALKAGYEDPLMLAKLKLTKYECDNEPKLHKLAQISILASRFHVQVNSFHPEAHELTLSHMAYVNGFDPWCKALVVSYPSDPLLSAAAQSILLDGLAANLWQTCLLQLSRSLTSQLTLSDDREGLVGQILCCYAADVVLKDLPHRNSSLVVGDFLKALIGDAALEAACSKGSLHPHTAQRLLAGRLNFHHFIRVQGYTPNREDLVKFLQRRAAVICEREEWGTYLIIPVVLEKPVENASAVSPKPTKVPLPKKFKPFPGHKLGNYREPTLQMVNYAMEVQEALKYIGVAGTMDAEKHAESDVPKAKREPRDSQYCSSASKGSKPEAYLLNAKSVSYIIVSCRAPERGETRCPKIIENLNPFDLGIEKLTSGPPPPYFALGMFFDSSSSASFEHSDLETYETVPMAEFKDWVDQYGLARAVTNVQMLQDAIKSAVNDLFEEIPHNGWTEIERAQELFRLAIQSPGVYGMG